MAESKKSDLRVKAEKILSQRGIDNSEYNKESLEKLIEELNIYQIELEHQNDELKRTQEDLEKKNEKFTDLYHNAPVSYFTIDQDYVIVNVNHKGAELFRLEIKDIKDTRFTEYIHPEFQDVYYHHHRKVLTEQKPDSCEIKIVTKQDNLSHIRLESIPTKEFRTHKMVLRTAIIDITSEKKIEEENHRRLHILKNISDSVIVTDLDGKITYWNQGAQEIFGYSVKEMLGKTPAILYPDMDPEKLDYDLEKIKAGKDYIGEWQGRTKKGDIVWVNIRTSALFDKKNKLVGFLGVAKNITDSKQKELYKTQLASIVEYSEDGIESMDVDGNILSWNKGAEKIFGYKASEIAGKNAIQLYPKAQKTELKSAITKIKNGESVSILETNAKEKMVKLLMCPSLFLP